MLVALVTGRAGVTDSLALWLLAARIIQSTIHLASLSNVAVTLRFLASTLQMTIGVYWSYRLIAD